MTQYICYTSDPWLYKLVDSTRHRLLRLWLVNSVWAGSSPSQTQFPLEYCFRYFMQLHTCDSQTSRTTSVATVKPSVKNKKRTSNRNKGSLMNSEFEIMDLWEQFERNNEFVLELNSFSETKVFKWRGVGHVSAWGICVAYGNLCFLWKPSKTHAHMEKLQNL